MANPGGAHHRICPPVAIATASYNEARLTPGRVRGRTVLNRSETIPPPALPLYRLLGGTAVTAFDCMRRTPD